MKNIRWYRNYHHTSKKFAGNVHTNILCNQCYVNIKKIKKLLRKIVCYFAGNVYTIENSSTLVTYIPMTVSSYAGNVYTKRFVYVIFVCVTL